MVWQGNRVTRSPATYVPRHTAHTGLAPLSSAAAAAGVVVAAGADDVVVAVVPVSVLLAAGAPRLLLTSVVAPAEEARLAAGAAGGSVDCAGAPAAAGWSPSSPSSSCADQENSSKPVIMSSEAARTAGKPVSPFGRLVLRSGSEFAVVSFLGGGAGDTSTYSSTNQNRANTQSWRPPMTNKVPPRRRYSCELQPGQVCSIAKGRREVAGTGAGLRRHSSMLT